MADIDSPDRPSTLGVSGRSIVHVRPTSLVGRDQERADVVEHIMTAPVTTLTGPGGVGKTALAMSVAAAVADDFPDGVKLGWLSSLRDASLVAAEVAVSVGLPRSGGQTYSDAIAEWLTDADVLLVLDNCEHVVAPIGDLIEELTARLPRLRVLATSREPLWVAGEVVYRLEPLPVAGPDATRDEIAASEAVQLFLERARARSPRTAMTDKQEQLVGEICRRLDGLPLAIELAAARVAGLELEDMATHLDDLFKLFPHTARRAGGDRRSLYSTVEWSYSLLADDERVLLRRMAVFAGDADLAAVEGVCASAGQSSAEIADLTARLVEKSLLIKNGSGGYHMLETIRQYASERLDESGEYDDLRDAHASWYLDIGQETAAKVMSGDERTHIETLTGMEDNIRLALARLIRHGDAIDGLNLASSLAIFWYIQGQHREGIRWLEEALDAAEAAPAEAQAAGLFNLAFLTAHDTDDWAAAGEILDRGIDLVSSRGDAPPILGYMLCLRGESNVFAGESAAAVDRTTRGLEIIRRFPDPWGASFGLWNVGYAHQSTGDIDATALAWQEMVDITRRNDIGLLLMIACNSLGELAEQRNDLVNARDLLEEALEQRRKIGASQLGYVHGSLPRSMLALARVAGKQGDHEVASDLLADALPMAKDMHDDEAVDEILGLSSTTAPATLLTSGTLLTTGTLRFEGQVWNVEFAGERAHVSDVRGLWHLRELLARPNQPIPAVVLAEAERGTPLTDGDSGPLLDRQALRKYRQRLADLDEDLAEASEHNDIERETMLQDERDALIAELGRATGLGGKQRRAGSSAERARLNVTRTVRHAIKQLEDAVPTLASHLNQSVRTGNFCAYEPAAEVTWQV